MNKERVLKKQRPIWLKTSLTIFSAWVTFILSIGILLIITLTIQKFFNDLIIEDTPAIILLIFSILTSVYVSYRFTKWLNKKLEKGDKQTSYFVLIILVILTILTLPAPFTYFYF
jgi:uncharacterized membrane protein YidH (DUF202 family)